MGIFGILGSVDPLLLSAVYDTLSLVLSIISRIHMHELFACACTLFRHVYACLSIMQAEACLLCALLLSQRLVICETICLLFYTAVLLPLLHISGYMYNYSLLCDMKQLITFAS